MRHVMAFAAALTLAAITTAQTAQKMTPEDLVKLHIQALTAGVAVPRDQARDVKGTVAAIAPARAAGLLPGTFRLSSGATNARLNLHFGTDLYEGETFTLEGDKVDIANAQPRTGSRSAVGNFVARNRVIVSEGLIGGVLNARWPLLDTAARKPKLAYDGLKTLAGRELHRLRYRAKDNQGSLEVELYFDPATYRHVASVYATSQSQQLGATPETSSQQGGPVLPDRGALRPLRAGWRRHPAEDLEPALRALGQYRQRVEVRHDRADGRSHGPAGAGRCAMNRREFAQSLASAAVLGNAAARKPRGCRRIAHRRARHPRRPLHGYPPADRLHRHPLRYARLPPASTTTARRRASRWS